MEINKKLIIKRVSIVLFCALALFFFIPAGPDCKVAWPQSVLAVTGFAVLPLPMALGMFFSAWGDWFGGDAFGIFILQMAFFALAHVFYIWYFLSQGLKLKKQAKKTSGKGAVPGRGATLYVLMTFIVAMTLVYVSTYLILPHVADPVLYWGVLVYIALITTMMWAAFQQRDWMFSLGAVLFVVSDFVLAYNKFVSAVPYESYIILGTYYLAQILLFLGAARRSRG